jgi:ubiquinol-cytochrome c reductase iron-sulfur subunit
MRPAERLVLVLLALTSLAAIGFVAVYLASGDTQLLGLSLGLAFCFLAAAAIVAGKLLVDQRKAVEERAPLGDAPAAERAARIIVGERAEDESPDEHLSRRRLLLGATGAAGALGFALVVPLASLGPRVGDAITDTPWRPGRRLVDDDGNPIPIDDVAVGSFLAAFAEGADKRDLGSSLVVVRIETAELELPPERAGWAPEGVLAFSRICPHAGCAISLFRYPLFEPTSPGPALVCPCHYSTFDVTTGGERIFGPAGRRLPQLPLVVDGVGHLVASGELSEPPGPSYLSVRRT